ncbi:MAG: VTT domain-containing protein [Limosilactobacillus sp.]|uniref:DedA family protein n=1 Tax=Limosilactobacillus sp. TaxID=2773925 RepID=UPI002707F556|nr:VTT domain-containing protein [Limosilactobacillus sp.]
MAEIWYFCTHIAEILIPMFEWLGPWSYLILFVIVFMETGLVVFPWLPGGSLVFLTSSFIAVHPVLKMHYIIITFFLAAFIGDSVNYWIGRTISRWSFIEKRLEGPRMLQAKDFLEKYGFWAVAFGRFVPLIRSFIPTIAGIMHYPFRKFTAGNIVGVATWVALGCSVGYYFGSIPLVKEHFSLVILAMVACALLVLAAMWGIKELRQRIIKKNKML